MQLLTVTAEIHADPRTEAVLQDAMFCATKVYNGLLWRLRRQYQESGKERVRQISVIYDERAFQVSPIKGSGGRVARPAAVSFLLGWHGVAEPKRKNKFLRASA